MHWRYRSRLWVAHAGRPVDSRGECSSGGLLGAWAGWATFGGDLFGDLDLRRCGPAVVVEQYPAGLADIARAVPPGPWMYTGGLENHPDLVDRIRAPRGRCWGIRAACWLKCGDPFQVGEVYHRAWHFLPCRCSRKRVHPGMR